MPDLLNEIRRQIDEARQADLVSYREIFTRADHPEPNDVAALRLLLTRLDFTSDRLGADLQILKQAKALESQAVVADADLDAKVEAASDAWQVYRKETARLADERKREDDRLYGEFTLLQHRRSNAEDKARQLRLLQMQHRELFGLSEPAPEPPPAPAMIGGIPFDIGQPKPGEKPRLVVAPVNSPRMIGGCLVYGGPTDKDGVPLPVDPSQFAPAAVAESVPPFPDESEVEPDNDEVWDAQLAATGPKMRVKS